MFRSACRRVVCGASAYGNSLRPVQAKCGVLRPAQAVVSPFRFYSAGAALTKEIVTERVLEILEDYDNVKNVEKIGSTANFSKDLGLDSLDQVEVIMEVENEFSILIPDDEADALKTVDQTVEYILRQPDAC